MQGLAPPVLGLAGSIARTGRRLKLKKLLGERITKEFETKGWLADPISGDAETARDYQGQAERLPMAQELGRFETR